VAVAGNGTVPGVGREPGRTAVGTWSGGRFLRFGEPISEERLAALLRPNGIDTLLTADAYGEGEADRLLGRALAGTSRDDYCLIGAVGHDFYEAERDGPRGFPRFTDRRLRGPESYADYLRMAAERSLERIGVSAFDLLLLHNPDRTGYTSERVWDGMAALRQGGLTSSIGVAPGPANGFSLDLIGCLERFGDRVDWAMIILNPLEPWPGELCLGAAAAHDVRVITRVVDYGGLFWDDLLPGAALAPGDHRAFRPEGWIEAGREKLDRLRPIAERAGLTPIQLACQWNLAHETVACTAPTLIQEAGREARPIERKRAELAQLPAEQRLSEEDVAEIRAIGDNKGCMALKGASPEHEGDERPDRWPLTPELAEAGRRWGIDPEADLSGAQAAV
jgi:aryl-alcohol dehydrogenase-like predicted oxidoreductase